MKRLSILCVFIGLLCVDSGCATKHYGRQTDLTAYEGDNLTCREIDIEIAKTYGFLEQVHKESEFDGRELLGILGDFGIGNAIERNDAVGSANRRLRQLRTLQSARCGNSSERRAAEPQPQTPVNYQQDNKAEYYKKLKKIGLPEEQIRKVLGGEE